MKHTLSDARRYERDRDGAIAPDQRPAFHLTPRTGWMNDPNGLSFYQGEYHLFYQYHPYGCRWGPMHWGHAVSTNLLSWRHLPAALAPDQPFDRDGCFSGTALTLPDGRQALLYTGVTRSGDGGGAPLQAQCLAVGDGLDYEKYPGNPVIAADRLPPDASRNDFRDPKLWRAADGSYCALIACSRLSVYDGSLLLYKSDDLIAWRYVGTVLENRGRIGSMWECPDLFSLDGRDVLILSAQNLSGDRYPTGRGHGVVAAIGTLNEAEPSFQIQSEQLLDDGIDFYAPQTLLLPDGRRILIGWMQNWSDLGATNRGWFGQMTLPRELTLKGDRLIQRPIRELERLRGPKATFSNLQIKDREIALPGCGGRTFDLDVKLHVPAYGCAFRRFEIRFAGGAGRFAALSVLPDPLRVQIDRSLCCPKEARIRSCDAFLTAPDGTLRIRLLVDRFSAEVFLNDGERIMTVTLDAPDGANGLTFAAEGCACADATFYPLRG